MCVASHHCEHYDPLEPFVASDELSCAVRSTDTPAEAIARLQLDNCHKCRCPPPPPPSCAYLPCGQCVSKEGFCAWNEWTNKCVPSTRCGWQNPLNTVANHELCSVHAADTPAEAEKRASYDECVDCRCPPPAPTCSDLRCGQCVSKEGYCAWNEWTNKCVPSTHCAKWNPLQVTVANHDLCAARATDTPAEADARASYEECVDCRC